MLMGLHLNFYLGPHICWRSGKEPARQGGGCRRHEFNPWVRKIPGGGNGNPLQHTCLENPMDRGAWQATVHGVSKSQTWLKSCTHKHTYSYTHTHTPHVGRGPHRLTGHWVGEGWEHCIHSTVSLTLPHLSLPGTLLPSPDPEAPLAHFSRLCLLPWTKRATPRNGVYFTYIQEHKLREPEVTGPARYWNTTVVSH